MAKFNLIIIYLFIGTSFLSSCKNNTKDFYASKSDSIAIKQNLNKIARDTLNAELPIGKKELLLENINNKIAKDSSLLLKLFKYYDTINGYPSSHFSIIKKPEYNELYKPKISDSREGKDSFFLKSEEGYNFFKLVKELPAVNKQKLLIFEGRSSNLDYDGNIIFTNRKDLVVLDDKKQILDAMNIYYSYSDDIYAKTKLFFIDKDHTISIRYYTENEEGQANFSNINKYWITKEGNILEIQD